MNNVYKRKDGRFEARIYLGRDQSGKRISRSFYGRTAQEAQLKLTAFYRLIVPEYSVTEMTVKELLSEWLEIIRTRVRTSTYANYRLKVEKHLIPAFGSIGCCDLRVKHIYDFIELKRSEGLSDRYISDMITLLKSVFRYANREYNIKNMVEGLTMHKAAKAEVRVLSEAELVVLKRYILEHQDTSALGVAMSLFMGLRIGELCALKWECVDIENRVVYINRTLQRIKCFDGSRKTALVIGEPKSKSSRRVIPIPDVLMQLLIKFRADKDIYILSGRTAPIEPRTMQYRFAKLLKNANLPSVHFHSLRHSFTSACIAAGCDVKSLSELLGHRSVSLTLNLYTHTDMERKRECVSLLKWAV